MKKGYSISVWLLFVLTILLPVGVLLTALFGYSFDLGNYSVFAICTAIVSLFITVLVLSGKLDGISKAGKVLFALLPFLSTANAAFCIFKCSSGTDEIVVAICMFACTVFAFIQAVKLGKPVALKAVGIVLASIAVLPVFALTLLPFGEDTVTQSLVSPQGGYYYAEVVAVNQGALGGDTVVYVYENKGVDLLAFRIYKSPERIYMGEWGEFEDMNIYWKDEQCLVINSAEYSVK